MTPKAIVPDAWIIVTRSGVTGYTARFKNSIAAIAEDIDGTLVPLLAIDNPAVRAIIAYARNSECRCIRDIGHVCRRCTALAPFADLLSGKEEQS